MLMRSLETNAAHRRHRASGFSLLEMMIVLAVMLIMTAVGLMSLMPAVQQQHVTNAYNTTMAAMRQARDNAVSQRTSYTVTFANGAVPNTVTMAPTLTFPGDQRIVIYQLPTDVQFVAPVPAVLPPPDNYGAGTNAIDFGYTASVNAGGTTQTVVYFCPDGSAQTAACDAGGYAVNWDGGVVYMALPGNVMSSRAISLWGGTGRIHGWRLVTTGGVTQWQRQ